MLKRDLYLERIIINDSFAMQIDESNHENLILYENSVEIEHFSLKKRIYTLFIRLQVLTQETDPIQDSTKNRVLYGKEIHIKDNIYMQLNDTYQDLAIDFYEKLANGDEELLYLSKLNYMTQKLFSMMLTSEKVQKEPNFQTLNPKLFKDFIDVMSRIKI